MSQATYQPIHVFERPHALKDVEARRGWSDAVTRHVNGWGIVNAEKHRVVAVKGNDLVFFAPNGSDFDNPVGLDHATLEAALQSALKWCRQNTSLDRSACGASN